MIFVTGCGSSGTKYICHLLKLNGLELTHDSYINSNINGVVTNSIVGDEVWFYDHKIYKECIKCKLSIHDFNNIIHLVRHPLKVIPSLLQKWGKHNNIWLHIKEGVLKEESNKDITILNAMKYWLYHNLHIMKITNKIIKLEDILDNPSVLNKYFNLKTIKPLNKKINSSYTKQKITWDNLYDTDYKLADEIYKLCLKLNYENSTHELELEEKHNY